jgi:hypothetical protein
MSSTKIGLTARTYAQNKRYSPSSSSLGQASRYKTHSARKSLIHKETLNCLFAGQSKESLDLQGSAAFGNKLSTKLSTENLDKSKTVTNQGLSRRSGCAVAALRRAGAPA